jgi:TolB protein
MNASTKDSANVSKGGADESPSLAPNGAMVVYATRAGGREQIAVSSDNGKSRQFLPIQGGSARDPAWSPYLP